LIENVSGVEVVSLIEGERWFLTGRERTQAGTAKYHIAVPDYYIHKQGDGTHTQYRYVPAYELKLK